MKHVKLERRKFMADRTLGFLSVWDGPIQVFKCASLELPWLGNKPRVSCVPAGTYRMEFEYSPAFKKKLWELKDVPGRSEVKIHEANYPKQLLGCIAPGLSHADIDGDGKLDTVSSVKALAMFHQALHGLEEVEITIVDAPISSM